MITYPFHANKAASWQTDRVESCHTEVIVSSLCQLGNPFMLKQLLCALSWHLLSVTVSFEWGWRRSFERQSCEKVSVEQKTFSDFWETSALKWKTLEVYTSLQCRAASKSFQQRWSHPGSSFWFWWGSSGSLDSLGALGNIRHDQRQKHFLATWSLGYRYNQVIV